MLLIDQEKSLWKGKYLEKKAIVHVVNILNTTFSIMFYFQ